MAEKEGSSKISGKLGGIDSRWGSGEMPESDINPYDAQRLKTSERRPKKESRQEEIRRFRAEVRAKLRQPVEIITTSKPKPLGGPKINIKGFGR